MDADLLVNKMKEDGIIDNTLFSFAIEPGNNQSHITFGGYDMDTYAKEHANLTWHELRSGSSHWEVTLESFGFNQHL